MVHYKGFIFIIAGYSNLYGETLNTVELFEIAGDQSFRPAPKLN